MAVFNLENINSQLMQDQVNKVADRYHALICQGQHPCHIKMNKGTVMQK
jgi:hypothetical protein